jgi:protein XagA
VEQGVMIGVARRSRNVLCVLVGVSLGIATVRAMAGAWTLDAGAAQGAVVGDASSADHIFGDDRTMTATPRYNKAELQGFFEYGATDWLTLMLLPSLQHIDIAGPVDARRTGLGTTEFGGRAKLAEADGWVASVQATLRLPGTFDTANPAAIGYTDTQTDVRVLLGRSFTLGTWSGFFDLQTGQRFRSEGAPDEWHTDVTFGIRPDANWMVLVQSFNVVSEGAGSWGFPSYDYFKVQLSAVYQLTPTLSLQFGGFSTVMGRNALQENGIVLGTWMKF